MKRLIKKSQANILNELDDADVKQDRCPNCRSQPLKRKDGFKYCRNCGNVYKIFGGQTYVAVDRGDFYGDPTPSNNDIF